MPGVGRTDGTGFEGTVTRATAQSEDGLAVRLFRDYGKGLQTYSELCGALESEASDVPPETWVDGFFDVGGYVVEAQMVGLIDYVDVVAAVVNRDTGGAVVEYTADDDEVVAERYVVKG